MFGNVESGSVVGSVPLRDWERNALKDYYRLIPTPRGATRFLNTYRLVRAGVLSTEWDRFRGDEGGLGEFRLPMLLLAVAAGQPSVAREWFRLLQQKAGGPLPQLESLSEREAPAWSEFRRLYGDLNAQVNVPLTPDRVMDWVRCVERFTF